MSRDSGQVVRRSIGIVVADGGLLTLSGTAAERGGGHGEEPLLAVLCDPDAAPVTFEEAQSFLHGKLPFPDPFPKSCPLHKF